MQCRELSLVGKIQPQRRHRDKMVFDRPAVRVRFYFFDRFYCHPVMLPPHRIATRDDLSVVMTNPFGMRCRVARPARNDQATDLARSAGCRFTDQTKPFAEISLSRSDLAARLTLDSLLSRR